MAGSAASSKHGPVATAIIEVRNIVFIFQSSDSLTVQRVYMNRCRLVRSVFYIQPSVVSTSPLPSESELFAGSSENSKNSRASRDPIQPASNIYTLRQRPPAMIHRALRDPDRCPKLLRFLPSCKIEFSRSCDKSCKYCR